MLGKVGALAESPSRLLPSDNDEEKKDNKSKKDTKQREEKKPSKGFMTPSAIKGAARKKSNPSGSSTAPPYLHGESKDSKSVQEDPKAPNDEPVSEIPPPTSSPVAEKDEGGQKGDEDVSGKGNTKEAVPEEALPALGGKGVAKGTDNVPEEVPSPPGGKGHVKITIILT